MHAMAKYVPRLTSDELEKQIPLNIAQTNLGRHRTSAGRFTTAVEDAMNASTDDGGTVSFSFSDSMVSLVLSKDSYH